mmetsp:Transcript_47130/g.91980  ORF Transcript_47130/g.91980 Transcript_47130/m.91980 type:complete len:333 (+) Transcript_47130:791-1789(+)
MVGPVVDEVVVDNVELPADPQAVPGDKGVEQKRRDILPHGGVGREIGRHHGPAGAQDFLAAVACHLAVGLAVDRTRAVCAAAVFQIFGGVVDNNVEPDARGIRITQGPQMFHIVVVICQENLGEVSLCDVLDQSLVAADPVEDDFSGGKFRPFRGVGEDRIEQVDHRHVGNDADAPRHHDHRVVAERLRQPVGPGVVPVHENFRPLRQPEFVGEAVGEGAVAPKDNPDTGAVPRFGVDGERVEQRGHAGHADAHVLRGGGLEGGDGVGERRGIEEEADFDTVARIGNVFGVRDDGTALHVAFGGLDERGEGGGAVVEDTGADVEDHALPVHH